MNPNPIELDGSQGEGGGQILRTALTLSMVSGKPFKLSRIRAGRRRPGLMRQHLMCVQAAAQISGAVTRGADPGSQQLEFHPCRIQAGDYAFRVATAGSSTLVFQTVTPALLTTRQPFRLVLEGGTHNTAAPSYDFIATTYAACLKALGVDSQFQLLRRGYYPAGGGQWTATLKPPATFLPFSWLDRRGLEKPQVKLILSRMAMGLIEREKALLVSYLNIDPEALLFEADTTSPGPGNVGIITLPSQPATEIVTLYGGFGNHTENATLAAIDEVKRYQQYQAPVGLHLADQLLPLLWCTGGGEFATGPLSSHARTQMDILRAFDPNCMTETDLGNGIVKVEVRPTMGMRPQAN
jgi:RNA 3'-terminal phosphate cyclase (ATP)